MKLYNTLTRQKEEFVPLEPGRVKMYTCGPTVYNLFHVGNARCFVTFDVLRRYFEYAGMQVTYVQNFTDIDDKVIRKAWDENTTYDKIAERYIKEYFVDAEGLGIKRADMHPLATENIDEIIDIVKTLVQNGYAYEVEGDVYFRTEAFKEYGKLSHQPMEELEAGARISVGEQKENPMDFALWKAAKPNEPSWDSPWGKGRPGWHIECSAMARKYLGNTIDIHAGGVDLAFPHHENEIAQSEAANGQQFVRYWLHNAFINIDNQKMSKSLNNFFTVREAAQQYGYEAIRFFILSAHYRSPLNYSQESLEQATAAVGRINTALNTLRFLKSSGRGGDASQQERTFLDTLPKYREEFKAAMEDDFNTAGAIGTIFELIREANIVAHHEGAGQAFAEGTLAMLTELLGVLGIGELLEQKELDVDVEQLIEARQQARADKNYKEADRIRDELKEMGIILEDTPQGVKWSRA